MAKSDVLEAALALSDDDKIILVERLLEALGSVTDGVDQVAFQDELNRRSYEIDQGTAKLVPWSELKNEKPID